jgi:hypothetical protein
MRPTMGLLACLALATACSGAAPDNAARAPRTDTLTARQRDSAFATSRVPGAAAVGRALQAADTAAARNAAMDSLLP